MNENKKTSITTYEKRSDERKQHMNGKTDGWYKHMNEKRRRWGQQVNENNKMNEIKHMNKPNRWITNKTAQRTYEQKNDECKHTDGREKTDERN